MNKIKSFEEYTNLLHDDVFGFEGDMANHINEMAETFKSQYEQLFQEMEANLSADANESIAWWGPQAGLFLNNFNKKKEDFNNAYKNVTSMATNLEEQAQAWDTFENA